MREHENCPSCICGRRALVQAEHEEKDPSRRKPGGTIAWSEHEETWAKYAARYGRDQSAERIDERGGFGYWEITKLLGHEPMTWAVRGAVAERERYKGPTK